MNALLRGGLRSLAGCSRRGISVAYSTSSPSSEEGSTPPQPPQPPQPQRRILSKEFALDAEWDARLAEMKKMEIGDSYDWIVSVQKKFTGGGKASAIDVDVATVMATEVDQKGDLLDLLYRLRHTSNAADLLPSTEYAFFRLLLNFKDMNTLFKVISDPINYGLFMNEHVSCLAIDSLLSEGNVQGAAKIATVTMQQEMFDNTLLNLLSLYSLRRFEELPDEEKVFSESVQPPPSTIKEEDVNDDEIRIIKYPYLKNEFHDGHFDLTDAKELVAKSLDWFQRSLSAAAADDVPAEELKEPISSKWDWWAEPLQSTCRREEQKLMGQQRALFQEWHRYRKELIGVQAERLNLRLRLEEIANRRAKLSDEKEVLFFFENRVHWEDEARQRDELFAELNLDKKDSEMTEKDYAKSLFEKTRKMVESGGPSGQKATR